MKARTLIPAMAAGGGVAALLFLGTGVTTGFTQSTLSSFGASTATLNTGLPAKGIFTAADLVPGDSVTDPVTISNTSTNPVDVTLQFGTLSQTGNLGQYIDLTFPSNFPVDAGTDDNLATVTADFPGPIDLGSLAAGQSETFDFVLTFASPKPGTVDVNSLAGQTASLPYTLTSTVESVQDSNNGPTTIHYGTSPNEPQGSGTTGTWNSTSNQQPNA